MTTFGPMLYDMLGKGVICARCRATLDSMEDVCELRPWWNHSPRPDCPGWTNVTVAIEADYAIRDARAVLERKRHIELRMRNSVRK